MVNRRLLRLAVFLLALGGMMLLGQAGSLDPELVRRGLGLWPVAVILLGVAILLRRSRLGLPAGVLAAAAPGLLLGGLVVALPDAGAHCRAPSPAGFQVRQGSFDAAATVGLTVGCSDLTVATMAGTGWEARIGQGDGPQPAVDAWATGLRVSTPPDRVWFGSPDGGDLIEVRLPTDRKLDLEVQLHGGHGRLRLPDANLGGVTLVVNAGRAELDLTDATLRDLSVRVNAGGGSLSLPATDFGGDLEVNGGELRVCVPVDLGLRIREDVTLGSILGAGLRTGRGRSTWESPNYAEARYHADLTVTINVGRVNINPAGGCQ